MQTATSDGRTAATYDTNGQPATLADMLKRLAVLRKQSAHVEEMASIANKAAMQTPQWQRFEELTAQLEDYREDVELLEAAIREDAENAYWHDGGRRPAEGVEVRLCSRMHYNPGVAELWTRANCPAALVFDAKRFEKIADELVGAPIVRLQEPKALIARDLSALLGEGGGE